MDIYPSMIKKWKAEKKKGGKLPDMYVSPLRVFLAHTDSRKAKMQTFCLLNKIKFEIR